MSALTTAIDNCDHEWLRIVLGEVPSQDRVDRAAEMLPDVSAMEALSTKHRKRKQQLAALECTREKCSQRILSWLANELEWTNTNSKENRNVRLYLRTATQRNLSSLLAVVLEAAERNGYINLSSFPRLKGPSDIVDYRRYDINRACERDWFQATLTFWITSGIEILQKFLPTVPKTEYQKLDSDEKSSTTIATRRVELALKDTECAKAIGGKGLLLSTVSMHDYMALLGDQASLALRRILIVGDFSALARSPDREKLINISAAIENFGMSQVYAYVSSSAKWRVNAQTIFENVRKMDVKVICGRGPKPLATLSVLNGVRHDGTVAQIISKNDLIEFLDRSLELLSFLIPEPMEGAREAVREFVNRMEERSVKIASIRAKFDLAMQAFLHYVGAPNGWLGAAPMHEQIPKLKFFFVKSDSHLNESDFHYQLYESTMSSMKNTHAGKPAKGHRQLNLGSLSQADKKRDMHGAHRRDAQRGNRQNPNDPLREARKKASRAKYPTVTKIETEIR